MLYCSTDMACDRCNVYVLVWRASFCPFTPLTAQKIKIKKKMKKTPAMYQKLWSDDVWFLRYGVWWMNRWKKDI